MLSKDLEARYLGAHVKYLKHGGRYGWVGQIIHIDSSRVHILYNNGKRQDYSIYALQGVRNSHREQQGYMDESYLIPIEEIPHEDVKYFMVLDAQGRQVYKTQDQTKAEKQAELLAKADNQGLPFYLLETKAMYQRETPPVVRTEL